MCICMYFYRMSDVKHQTIYLLLCVAVVQKITRFNISVDDLEFMDSPECNQ